MSFLLDEPGAAGTEGCFRRLDRSPAEPAAVGKQDVYNAPNGLGDHGDPAVLPAPGLNDRATNPYTARFHDQGLRSILASFQRLFHSDVGGSPEVCLVYRMSARIRYVVDHRACRPPQAWTLRLLVVLGCSAGVGGRYVRAQRPASSVVVAEARMLEAPSTITLVGTVNAVRRSRVSSEIAGIVIDLPVRQGDRRNAGDVLCRLNAEALRLRLEESTARLGALQAVQEELEAGTRPEELKRLQALLDEAAAEHDRWTFEMDRIKRLYEGSDSNAKEFTDTRASYLAAHRRKIAAEASYELGLNGPRKEAKARAAFEVAEQQAVVDRIEHDLRKTTIRAPWAGFVVRLFTEVGEWVPVGGEIVEMVDLSTMLVRVDVPESAIPYAKAGASVRVHVDALKRSFVGKIAHIIRQADERARTFPVEIELDNHDGVLASGMFARATLASGPSAIVMTVPKDAIVEKAGVSYVATVMPGQQGGLVGVLTAVTLGSDVGDFIAVTSGNIQVGTRVITRGNETMKRFPKPVRIVDKTGTPIGNVEQRIQNGEQSIGD